MFLVLIPFHCVYHWWSLSRWRYSLTFSTARKTFVPNEGFNGHICLNVNFLYQSNISCCLICFWSEKYVYSLLNRNIICNFRIAHMCIWNKFTLIAIQKPEFTWSATFARLITERAKRKPLSDGIMTTAKVFSCEKNLPNFWPANPVAFRVPFWLWPNKVSWEIGKRVSWIYVLRDHYP